MFATWVWTRRGRAPIRGGLDQRFAGVVLGRCFAAWADPEPAELVSLFDVDAVGRRSAMSGGADAVTAELVAQVAMAAGVTIDVKSLVAESGTIMVDSRGRHGRCAPSLTTRTPHT